MKVKLKKLAMNAWVDPSRVSYLVENDDGSLEIGLNGNYLKLPCGPDGKKQTISDLIKWMEE